MIRILALDLGKHKSVACDYEAEVGSIATTWTNPKAVHDLIVDREPDPMSGRSDCDHVR